MQKLILADDIFDALEKGKKCTIRKGKRDISLGELLFQSLESKREKIVFVNSVVLCAIKDIPKMYYTNDGFVDVKDMIDKMKRFYPDINENTESTIISF